MSRNPFTRRLPGGRIVLNHLPGQHDQQTHGGRGGTATAPRVQTKVIGGLELLSGKERGAYPEERVKALQPVDPRNVRGDSDYDYDVAAARMRDGMIYANADGHARAMADALRAGYTPKEIQSVGFYWRRGAASPNSDPGFEPYHINDYDHIKMMMGYAGDLAGGTGWSLDHLEGQHDQETHGNRGGGGGEKSELKDRGRTLVSDGKVDRAQLAATWSAQEGPYEWTDMQHAARHALGAGKTDDYVCYDCRGDDRTRLEYASAVLKEIENSPTIDAPLYRGLRADPDEFKVGDTFSESLTSWTGKEALADEFAAGGYDNGPREYTELFGRGSDKPRAGAVIMRFEGTNMKGINLSKHLNPRKHNDTLLFAEEWLTSGRYEVTKRETVERAGVSVTMVSVRRLGPAQAKDVRHFATQHLPGQHDQQTHGGEGESWMEKGQYHVRLPREKIIGPSHSGVSSVRTKDGLVFTAPPYKGMEAGTHGDAMIAAYRKGYKPSDFVGYGYLTDNYTHFDMPAGTIDHYKAMAKGSWDLFKAEEKRKYGGDGWSLDHLEGQHDQQTHGRGGGEKAKPRIVGPTGTMVKGYMYSAVRMKDGTIYLPPGSGYESGTHYDALRAAFKDGYSRADVAGFAYMTDKKLSSVDKEYSGFYKTILDTASVDHEREKAGFSLDAKRMWPLRATQHGDHDQKTHGNRDGEGQSKESPTFGTVKMAGGLVFSESKQFPATFKIESGYLKGDRNGLYAVRMYDGTVFTSNDGHMHAMRLALKEYKRSDFHSVGFTRDKEGDRSTELFEPYAAKDFNHVNFMVEAAVEKWGEAGRGGNEDDWNKAIGKAGWSLDHLEGQHDQKDHGNRQGVGGKPDDHGTKIVGGLELRKGWDVRQPVDKKQVTGVYSDKYASVQAVRMKDGSIHAHDSGHAQAMYEMMRKGYKREDFQSVGFYLPRKSAFEPYHVRDIGHINYMMDHAEQRARTMDLSGWSLDRRREMKQQPKTIRLPGGRIVTNHGDHDQKSHGNRGGAGVADSKDVARIRHAAAIGQDKIDALVEDVRSGASDRRDVIGNFDEESPHGLTGDDLETMVDYVMELANRRELRFHDIDEPDVLRSLDRRRK